MGEHPTSSTGQPAEVTDAPDPLRPRARTRPLRIMLRGLAATVPAGLVALLLYGVLAKNPNTTIDDSLSRGHPIAAPAFRLAALQPGSLGPLLAPKLTRVFDRRSVALADLRGTPVVLNFWASWCVVCQEEAATLQRAWRMQARPHGVLFLGLDEQDVTTDAQRFLRHYHIDYPNIREPTNDTALTYGVTGVPETFFIDAQGQIVGHIIGESTGQQLAEGITAAQSGQVVRSFQGGAQEALR
ncbi:MAG: TlpA family protein disulfide reductase [Solirubrobacteraceae bacterium]